MTFCRIQQFEVRYRQIDIAVVVTAGDILQKPPDYRRRNHVPDILGNVSAVSLKCDSNDPSILHYRTTRVPRIDRRVQLNRQMRIDTRMRVGLKIDSRNDSSSYGQSLTADWISVNGDR